MVTLTLHYVIIKPSVVPSRDDRILSLRAQVESCAHRMRRRIPYRSDVKIEDLIGAAWLGAMEAVDKYEDGHGAQLNTFVGHRIIGAIQDYLREWSGLTRPHWDDIKAGRASRPEFLEVGPRVNRVKGRNHGLICWPHIEPRTSPWGTINAGIDASGLMAILPPRDRRIMELHYMQEIEMVEIARMYGISQCRVTQIIKRGLRRMACG